MMGPSTVMSAKMPAVCAPLRREYVFDFVDMAQVSVGAGWRRCEGATAGGESRSVLCLHGRSKGALRLMTMAGGWLCRRWQQRRWRLVKRTTRGRKRARGSRKRTRQCRRVPYRSGAERDNGGERLEWNGNAGKERQPAWRVTPCFASACERFAQRRPGGWWLGGQGSSGCGSAQVGWIDPPATSV